MKFEVNKLGPINHATFELGALTMICGDNNNGKSYLTYTLESFLSTIENNLEVPLRKSDLDELLLRGSVTIDLMTYINEYLHEIASTVPRFVKTLPRLLVMHPDRFSGFDFKVLISKEEIVEKFRKEATSSRFVSGTFNLKISEKTTIRCVKNSTSTIIRIEIVNKADVLPPSDVIARGAAFTLSKMFDDGMDVRLFPEPFIITCERTGVLLFKSELAAALAKTYDKFGKKTLHLYQRPVEKEVDYILNLKGAVQEQSILAREHPEILKRFREIVRGGYSFDADSLEVKFTPDGSDVQLSLAESSSTIRSLSELYFYLAHSARPGQVLIFDEPELNLHPANQRRLARLLVLLVRYGVKVLINTHSDYIVREINVLLSIVATRPEAAADVLTEFGYEKDLILDKADVKAYILREGSIEEVDANDDGEFAFKSFDDTLSEYARLFRSVAEMRRSVSSLECGHD